MIEAGKRKEKTGTPRIARKLLVALGKLDAAYREKVPKGDFRLVPGSLREDGCSVDVAVLATKEKPKSDPQTTLRDIAKQTLGGIVVDDAEHPGRLTLTVEQAPDDTPSGALQVTFDPKAFLGQILALKKPASGEVLLVRYLLRFYNGGHVVELTGSRDCGPDGSCSDIALVERKTLSSIAHPALPDVRSSEVHARIALPQIVRIRQATDAGGLRLTADLSGGDIEFWKAAKPAFQLDGKPPKEAAIANGKVLTATFTPKEVGNGGATQIVAKTLVAATYAGAEIAAGSVPTTFAEDMTDNVPALTLSNLEVKRDEKGAFELSVTAKGPRVPLSVVFAHEKSSYRPIGTPVSAGPDDIARGTIDVLKLGKSKKPRSFTITVTAKWDGKVEATTHWTYPPEEPSP
ncbi:hypothetical protein A7982_12104 [Minicystis rosea]|nr:hypothetical protein A7982_12104 [Minicystis rosea]